MAEESKSVAVGGGASGEALAKRGKIILVLLFALIIFAGGLSTIQAPINASLKNAFTGDFTTATFISYFTSGILLLLLARIMHAPQFKLHVKGTRWWQWLGGCAGVLYVCGFTIATAQMGSAAATGGLVFGQLFFGLIADQIGFLGLPKRKITLQRVVGVALVFAGAFLVFNF